MRTRRKCLASLPLSLSFLLLVAPTALAAFQNDFSKYPENSQKCLYDAADKSNCNGDTVEAMNKCLCGNGGNFALNAAACIYKSDNANLQKVYTTMADACEFSKTPLDVTQKDFLNAGSTTTTSAAPTRVTTAVSTISGKVTTVVSTSDPTATSGNNNNNNNNNNGDGGMSSTARTGIIAGATVAGVAILAAIVFFVLRFLRGRNTPAKDESHPMLAQPKWGPSPSNDLSSRHTSGDMSAFAAQQEWKQDGSGAAWKPSHSPDHWSAGNTPAPGQYNPSWGTASPPPQHTWGYSPGASYQQYAAPQVSLQPTAYELAGPEPARPTEMPASPLQHGGGGVQHPMQAQQSPHPAQGWNTYNGR